MTKSIIDNQISVYDCSFYQRISVFIPNEIKEGQARFTMITSVGRTYYVLFKWATELIKNLFAFIVFSLLCFAVVAMFYPTGGKYVLVATITNSFLLNYGASCFLQIVFGVHAVSDKRDCLFRFACSEESASVCRNYHCRLFLWDKTV